MSGDNGLFRPVQPVRTFDDIVLQIQLAIRNGSLVEGDRLPSERELAETFQASRATVREALRLLEGCRQIIVRRGAHGGVFVTEPDKNNVATAVESLVRFRRAGVAELAEFRPKFEAENAQLAAVRANSEEAADIMKTAEAYATIAPDDDLPWSRFVDLDTTLHAQVAAATKNEIRHAISLGLNRAVREASLALAPVDVDFRSRESLELLAIAEAIRSRDAEAAHNVMLDHVSWNSALEVEAMSSEDGKPDRFSARAIPKS